ncbi:MAG: glycosyltransferase family 9 protein [Bacteroidales bacterium]
MKKILIIRFSSIGDIVLTTPVIRCIKNQIADAEIHYLTKKQFVPILEANPYIDKLFSIEDKIAEVLPELKKGSYDYIVDLHKNFRSRGIVFNLRKPASSFSKLNYKKWLVVNLKIDTLPDIHIVDRYFEAVKKPGVKNDNKGLDYFIPEKDEVQINSLPETHQKGFIGWVIGGKHKTKIYPEVKIIEVCKNTSTPLILLGGPEDAEKGERIAVAAGKHVYNSCGKFNLNQSASLVKQSKKSSPTIPG